jgi:hypothetical protein
MNQVTNVANVFLKNYFLFRNCIEIAKEHLQYFNDDNGLPISDRVIPNSLEVTNHISWDFAEQIYLPQTTQQEVNNL